MNDEELIREQQEFNLTGFQKSSILVVCFLLYMINFMDKQVLSVVMEPMKQDLGLTDTMVGLLQTTFFLGMAFFALPSAYLVDRWSRRKALSLMAIVWSVFTYVTGLGRSFIGVLIPRILVGVGEAAFPAAGTAMLSAAFSKESRSRILGIFNASIPLGIALGTMLGGYIAAKYGSWRTPFFIFSIPGIILGLLALALKDYKTVKEVDDSGKRKGFIKTNIFLLKIPTVRWLALGYAMQLALTTSFMVWIPAFLMRSRGIPVDQAGYILGSIGLLGIIGAPLGGILADMWQKKNIKGRPYTSVAVIFPATIAYILSIYFELKGIGCLFGIIWGISCVMSTASINSISQDVVSPGLKGAAWGLVGFSAMIGSALAPSIIGAISDSLGGDAAALKTALLSLSVTGVMAACFFIAASKTYPADVDKVKGFVLVSEKLGGTHENFSYQRQSS